MSSTTKPTTKIDQTHNHQVKLRPYSRLMHWYRWNDVYIPFFNPAARMALRAKYLNDKRQIEQYYKGREVEAELWFKKTPLFFGFSSPRSGTVFMTDLLLNEIKDGIIEHEANIVDYPHYAQAIQSQEDAYQYIHDFRKKDIYYRSQGKKVSVYGEVNPFLRMHCKAIARVFPKAKLFHLVRNGKSIVASVMSRDKLGRKDPMSVLIYPPKDDAYYDGWKNLSRFEKVCWQWQFTNRFMRENLPHRVYFEKIRSDYDYFKTEVSDYLNLPISQKSWENYVSVPKNATPKQRFPKPKDWAKEQHEIFERICGEEMNFYDF